MTPVLRRWLALTVFLASVAAPAPLAQERQRLQFPDLAVTAVRAPQEIRYGTCNTIEVDVENLGSVAVSTSVTVALAVQKTTQTPQKQVLRTGLAANAKRTLKFTNVDLSKCAFVLDESGALACAVDATVSATRTFERNTTNNKKTGGWAISKKC